MPAINLSQPAGRRLDFPEFKPFQITISEWELENPEWQKWLSNFVSNNQEENISGTLQLLAPDLRDILFELTLFNIFIVSTVYYQKTAEDETAKTSPELMFDYATVTSAIPPAPESKFIRSGVGIKLPGANK